MLKLFLSNRAIALFLLPLIIGAYLFFGFYSDKFQTTDTINLGFFGLILANKLVTGILSFILVLSNSIMINYLFNKNEFYDRNSYSPSLLYVVLMSFYHSFYSMDGLLIAHSFIILMLFQFFHLKQNEDSRSIVFNASFFAGLAAIVHPPVITILPFLFLMVWSVRPFVLRESLLLITGFGLPLIYGGFYLTWLNTSIDLKLLKQTTSYDIHRINFLVTATLFLSMLLLSLIGIQSKMRVSSIRFKKLVNILWIVFFVGLILGVGDYVFFGQIERFSFVVLSVPFFLPYAFFNKSWSKIAKILFYLCFIYSFVKFFL